MREQNSAAAPQVQFTLVYWTLMMACTHPHARTHMHAHTHTHWLISCSLPFTQQGWSIL